MTTHRPWLACFVVAAAMSLATEQAIAQATDPTLQLESKIPLGDVRGRIDHRAAGHGLRAIDRHAVRSERGRRIGTRIPGSSLVIA